MRSSNEGIVHSGTDPKLIEATRVFHQLVNDAHPGLATWVIARNDACQKLYDLLKQVVPKP
ncbi:MAG: hypothetical protein KW788_04225 [Candidatus Doudnabacteria bacterium]|nr:hypothetical protein [Candidatus Doudnabacteria bacterium]